MAVQQVVDRLGLREELRWPVDDRPSGGCSRCRVRRDEPVDELGDAAARGGRVDVDETGAREPPVFHGRWLDDPRRLRGRGSGVVLERRHWVQSAMYPPGGSLNAVRVMFP
jgi:hypothetical protein